MKNNRVFALCSILILVVISGSSVLSAENDNANSKNDFKIDFLIEFDEPYIYSNGDFLRINFENTNSFTVYQTEPIMPFYSKTFEFPMGTIIKDIIVKASGSNYVVIDDTIEPVPQNHLVNNEVTIKYGVLNEEIYSSYNNYPDFYYKYNKGVGLNKQNEHVLFLSVHMFPAQYIPQSDTIKYFDKMDLSISYIQPELVTNGNNNEKYDLIIICPSEYKDKLNPLKNHKNRYDVETKIVTLDEIYNEFIGRDNPEKIKYFVKHASEEWDTKYVLLVGDVKKLPIRKTYASWWEADILSDLYYSDFYNSDYEFCSWDSNENNKFGEIEINNNNIYNLDKVDLFADVHIGRLPCINIHEVEIVVDKILNYENIAYDQLWFNTIILAGGDTFPPGRGALPFVYEGEITNKKVMQQLPNFEHITLWASKHNLNAFRFNLEISKGAGFVTYAGHGFEHGWGTYRKNSLRKKMGLTEPLYYMPFVEYLYNRNKLPVIFFDACLTAKLDFNVTDLREYYSKFINFLTFFRIVDDNPLNFYPCFAYSFIKKEGGGAIATVGATRTAYTYVDKDGVYAGAGYLDVQFFKSFEDGITVGEMLTQAQNNYINNVFSDFFTIEEYILLGDPSLMVGGRP